MFYLFGKIQLRLYIIYNHIVNLTVLKFDVKISETARDKNTPL